MTSAGRINSVEYHGDKLGSFNVELLTGDQDNPLAPSGFHCNGLGPQSWLDDHPPRPCQLVSVHFDGPRIYVQRIGLAPAYARARADAAAAAASNQALEALVETLRADLSSAQIRAREQEIAKDSALRRLIEEQQLSRAALSDGSEKAKRAMAERERDEAQSRSKTAEARAANAEALASQPAARRREWKLPRSLVEPIKAALDTEADEHEYRIGLLRQHHNGPLLSMLTALEHERHKGVVTFATHLLDLVSGTPPTPSTP